MMLQKPIDIAVNLFLLIYNDNNIKLNYFIGP